MSEPPDLTVENESLTLTEPQVYRHITVSVSGSLYIQAYVKAKKCAVTGSGAMTEVSGSGYLEITAFSTKPEIFDELGNAFVTGSLLMRVLEIKEGREVILANLFAGDYLQHLGTKNRVFRVEIIATGSDLQIPRNNILDISGRKGYLMTSVIPQTYVLFVNPEVTDTAGRPFEIKGVVTAIEFK